MKGPELEFRPFAFGNFLLTTHLNGNSSMQMRQDLGVEQNETWFPLQNTREVYEMGRGPITGTVRIDEIIFHGWIR